MPGLRERGGRNLWLILTGAPPCVRKFSHARFSNSPQCHSHRPAAYVDGGGRTGAPFRRGTATISRRIGGDARPEAPWEDGWERSQPLDPRKLRTDRRPSPRRRLLSAQCRGTGCWTPALPGAARLATVPREPSLRSGKGSAVPTSVSQGTMHRPAAALRCIRLKYFEVEYVRADQTPFAS
ncbi:hypothetical protein KM043_006611 [Ampulex compressa]|nr:hypothetical protein KM043_006611 [Ampulex compressa]